jgi:hypothetical protein
MATTPDHCVRRALPGQRLSHRGSRTPGVVWRETMPRRFRWPLGLSSPTTLIPEKVSFLVRAVLIALVRPENVPAWSGGDHQR